MEKAVRYTLFTGLVAGAVWYSHHNIQKSFNEYHARRKQTLAQLEIAEDDPDIRPPMKSQCMRW